MNIRLHLSRLWMALGAGLLSGMTPPSKPPPPRPTMMCGSTETYAKAVLQAKPIAYWRLHDSAKDARSGKRHGVFEDNAAPVLPKEEGDSFKGGCMSVQVDGVGDHYGIEFWFRNSLPIRSRPVTAYLFSRGVDGMKMAEGDHLGIGGTHAAAGRLIVYQGNLSKGLLTGSAKVDPDSWHHVVLTREGERIRVYLNGNPRPDIDGRLARSYPVLHPQFFLGGRTDNFANLQGRLDEVALYERVLTPREVTAHFKAVKLTPNP